MRSEENTPGRTPTKGVEMEKVSMKKVAGIILAAACIVACYLIVPPEGMSHEGLTALGILLGGVVCWITNCLPMGLSCITMLFLAYTLGVGTSNEILSGFMSTIVLFVMAMFAFAAVMTKTNLTKRIVGAIMSWAGTNSRKVIIGFFVGAFVVSAFMSAVPVCAMFGGLALSLLKNKDEVIEEYKPLGRSLMIAIPMASLLGNFVTPAGNSINLLVMGGYTQVTGAEITFAQWCMFGAPIAIVIGAIGLIMILKMFKVEDLSEESLIELKAQTSSLGKLDAQEIKFLVIFGAMIVLWFASSFGLKWPGVVDTALIGMILLFIPGINLLTGEEFVKSVNWDVIILTGTLLALGGVIQSTGAITFIVNSLLSDPSAMPFLLVVLMMSLIPCIIHIFVPLAGAIYALTLIPLVTVAVAAGINPLIPMMMVGIWLNFECILPTDTIFMLTYAHGFYEFKDTIRMGIPLTIITVCLTLIWVPFAAGLIA